ncbi:MAG: hypothetical protein KDD43_17095 [Bdellovibrionales bacterium]|nr:hypothetical protein [Bdellovibrionales bacterium]
MVKISKALIYCLLLSAVPSAQAEVESWYTYWAFGFGSANYSGDIKTGISELENSTGFDHSSTTAVDLFGFYWPVFEQNTIMGVVLNGVTESYRSSGLNADASLTTSQLSFSTLYFFGEEPGDNFFLRGDVGIGRVGITVTNDQNISLTGATESGIGIRLGAGYGIPVSGESRVLITFLLGKNNTDEGDSSTASLLVGGLW